MTNSANTAQRVYVARVGRSHDIYAMGDEFICLEGVFSSWTKAREFLAREETGSADEDSRLRERHTIIQYSLDDDEPGERTQYWVFDVDGNLLEEWPTKRMAGAESVEYNAKCAVGEIVHVKPNIDCPDSYSIEGFYGIVLCTPMKKQEWLAEHHLAEDWDGCYVVNYVARYGILSHVHVPESALDSVSDSDEKVPPFLRLYSKHMKGQLQLPEQLLLDLEEGRAFLRDDVKHYQSYLDA